jgi:VanZ family protein
MTTFYRATTVLLILGLFTIGSMPAAGQVFHGTMHSVAHLSAYALIAFAFGLGWQRMQATHIAAIVATIGCIHELTEIITHSHGFEINDVVINAIGALIGVTILSGIRKLRKVDR